MKFARKQARPYLTKKIHVADLAEVEQDGWFIERRGKKSIHVKKNLTKGTLLERRVWTVLFRMGFEHLSGDGGAQLVIQPKDPQSPKTQIDCVAVDQEVGLACECKSFQDQKKDPDFKAKLAELAAIRKGFAESLAKQFPLEGIGSKRHIGTVLFTWDFMLSEADVKRAEAQKIVLFNEEALVYYERLLEHLGPATRYQFLSDVFPSMQIAGLEVKVPALRAKAGKTVYYTFSMQPEYLLKIAYVAHRAKGREKEAGAYQRMISKPRLKKIRKYISDGGNFPTNIVLNIRSNKFARFDQGKQEGGPEGARLGVITLSPTYGSAWVIDGQHRLFAYSGHKRASTSYLNVLAFEGLSEDEQAKLFVDINHEQKSVSSNLLDELWSVLHWEATDEETRTRAIISRAIQELNEEKESSLCGRILLADQPSSDQRCISLTSAVKALNKSSFYTTHGKRDVAERKALWASTPDKMLARTKTILNGWFGTIAEKADNWWRLGKTRGGGLAMNNGVTASINVLRDVFAHVEAQGSKLSDLGDHEVVQVIQPYAVALGNALANWSPEKRDEFRKLQGAAGQDEGTKLFEEEIFKVRCEFQPQGLMDFIEGRKQDTRTQAFKLISQIERNLKAAVIPFLKRKFSAYPKPDAWWWDGVPPKTREKVFKKMNDSAGEEGEREDNLDLIDYREILLHNWADFAKTMAFGKGSKKDQTGWLEEVNKIRKFTDHHKHRHPLIDEVRKLQQYNAWLEGQINSAGGATPSAGQ